MGVYKQQGSKYWWINIYRGKDLPRLQVSSGTENKADAQAIEAILKTAHTGNSKRDGLISAIDTLIGTEDRRTGIPIVSIASTYTKLPDLGIATLSLKRHEGYIKHLSEFLGEHWPSFTYMHQISREAIIAYADHLRSECKTGKTYNNRRGTVVTVFGKLMVRAGLSENVAELMPTAKKGDSKSGRSFTRTEEKRVFKAARTFGFDWYEVSLVSRYTGLRYGDVAKLRPENIVSRTIQITPSKTEHHKIVVVIPLHQKLVDMFASRDLSSEWIFPGHAMPSRKTKTSSNVHSFGKILEAAEIADERYYMTFHCWRHTFRTRLAEAGVSQEIAKQLGGWTDDKMAAHYNHDLTQAEAAIKSLK